MTRKKRIVALYEVYQPKWDLFPNCCNDELAQLKKKSFKTNKCALYFDKTNLNL